MKGLILISSFILIRACTLFDSFDGVPMFLIAQEVSLESTPGTGANTHKIKDLSVYENGINIGVFEVPSDIFNILAIS